MSKRLRGFIFYNVLVSYVLCDPLIPPNPAQLPHLLFTFILHSLVIHRTYYFLCPYALVA